MAGEEKPQLTVARRRDAGGISAASAMATAVASELVVVALAMSVTASRTNSVAATSPMSRVAAARRLLVTLGEAGY